MNRKLTILIIDDAVVIIDRMVLAIAEMKNVETVLAGGSFEEGVQLLNDHNIDVAIIDVNLPGKSGIELLQFIKEKNYPVDIIIIMTETPSEHKKQKCLSAGADYFLNKFDALEKIMEIIENSAKVQ